MGLVFGPVRVVAARQTPLGVDRLQVVVPDRHLDLDMPEAGHGDHLVPAGETNAPDARRGAARKHANVGYRKADALAAAGGHEDVLVLAESANPDQPVSFMAVFELHGDFAVGHHIGEIAQAVAPHVARRGREDGEQVFPRLLVLGQRHHRRNRFALVQGQDVHQRLAAGLRTALGQFVDLELVDDAGR